MFSDFERETVGLDQEIRKQIGELKGFQPQTQKIESLEERMTAGRQKAEALGKRMENMRKDIDSWEKREADWQARVGWRLRIFWFVAAASVFVLLVAVAVKNWPGSTVDPEALRRTLDRKETYPTGLAYRHATCAHSSVTPASTDGPTGHDPLRILDEI